MRMQKEEQTSEDYEIGDWKIEVTEEERRIDGRTEEGRRQGGTKKGRKEGK